MAINSRTKPVLHQRMKGQVVVEYVIAVAILSLVMLSLPQLLELLAVYQGSQAAAQSAVFGWSVNP